MVFSDRALEFLRGDDPATYDAITPQMEQWTDLTVVHRGTPVVIDGIGFSAIGRLKFLRLMQQRAASVGVVPEFRQQVSPSDFEGLRPGRGGRRRQFRRCAGRRDFGTTITPLTNKFAWFGTTSVFPTLTQTFVENEHGHFNAHHYRHSPQMSTFVFECDAATWERAGFAAMDEAQTMALLRTGCSPPRWEGTVWSRTSPFGGTFPT